VQWVLIFRGVVVIQGYSLAAPGSQPYGSL
jgi:hypothetical protein